MLESRYIAVGKMIETETDLDHGIRLLTSMEPAFGQVVETCGRPPLRSRPGGFPALLNIIVSQQLSVAAADRIADRLRESGLLDARAIQQVGDDVLRKCGLSRQKIRYIRNLAASELDYAALGKLDDKPLISELTSLDGIGVWSAEIYALFCLGRRDIFPAGDLALRLAAQSLFELADCPSERQLRILADPWSPWRSVAARLLWSHYRNTKRSEGIR